MFRAWGLGRFFGIRVYVHWTFLLIPLLAFVAGIELDGVARAVFGAGLVFAAFGCVLLHEFGHALMARRFGIRTRDITLYPIGGVARLERMSTRPWEELLIALAGPAVNLAIAAALFPVLLARVAASPAALLQPVGLTGFLAELFFANVVLVVFNLLPAFPMDGGRVLRALLATRIGHLRATEVAAGVGSAMAGLFVFGGVVSFFGVSLFGVVPLSPFLAVVGFYVYTVGQHELAAVRHREAQHRDAPLTVLPANYGPVSVPRDQPASEPPVFVWDSQAGLWVLWRNGRPVGILRGPDH